MRRLMMLILLIVAIIAFGGCGQSEEIEENVNVTEFAPEPDPEPIIPETVQEAFEVKEDSKTDVSGVWEGYPEESFDVFLEKALSVMFESDETTVLKSCEVIAVEGWNCEGFLDESSVVEGSSAISYVADMLVTVEGEDINRGVKIYTELKTDGTLNIMGAEMFEANLEYGQVYEAEEALGLLEELKSYLKSMV